MRNFWSFIASISRIMKAATNRETPLQILICLLLAAVTLVIYWPARHFDIIYLDDPGFVTAPEVLTGLNWHSFDWAMKSVVLANWYPITNLSFLLTHQFFGFNPETEHLVNVIFHATNAVLVFLILLRLTGATWRSAFVSAIFAWHPLRVESVAWVAERKDMLFAFFMLLSLLCYVKHARAVPFAESSNESQDTDGAARHPYRSPYYWGALLFFALSLLSKATVITLPFLLLLLDFWPLRRLNRSSIRPLLVEKIPFFLLTFFFCALTFWIPQGDIERSGTFGTIERLENVTLSYVNYMGKLFWPVNLAVPYPYPQSFDPDQVLLSGMLLLAISALCILQVSRRPYLATGWFWFMGAMVPVIGLVQIGGQAMADRHSYIPLIGPVVSLVWLACEWVHTKMARNFLGTMAVVVLAVCVVLTRRQLMYWQNTVTLFQHSVAVTPENAFAEYPLAMGLEEQGRWREAATQFRVAINMHPGAYHYLSNLNFGILLAQMGYYSEAEAHLESALELNSDSAQVMNTLAWLLATCPDGNARDGQKAVELGERACELTNYKETLFIGTLAAAYAEAGRFDDAVATAQKAINNAQAMRESDLVQNNEKLMEFYRAHKAYHETSPPMK